MIEKRSFDSLGAFQNDWLNAKHHFSFGHYHDPNRMGVGVLRVWNDDTIKAGAGFDPHPHNDMEIITYVRKGAITHKDILGNEGRTVAGDVQVMHAGTGIVHAEYNLEPGETQIFQIWILPDRSGHAPGWGAKEFPKERTDGFRTLASGRTTGETAADALPINQDAAVLGAKLNAGDEVTYTIGRDRKAYLVPTVGKVEINGEVLNPRDGLAVTEEEALVVKALEDTEIIMVDVP